MRNGVVAVALGFLAGAAGFVGGQQPDRELARQLRDLQRAAGRVLAEQPPQRGEMPPLDERGTEFRLFPVWDLVAGRPDVLPPDHAPGRKSRAGRPLFETVSDEWLQPFGTEEEILELVRARVFPASWETEGTMLYVSGATLIAVNSPAVLDAIGEFLDERLRAAAHRCAAVEAEVVDLPRPLAAALASHGGTALAKGQRAQLEAALAAGTARRVFGARATGFLGQRILLWHGRQVAIASASDVEVATKAAVADPNVGVLQAGGYLSVLVSAGDPGRVTLDLDVRFDELAAPLVTVETDQTGPIDRPCTSVAQARTTLTLPDERWGLAAAGSPHGDRVRVVLVRATTLERSEGGR